VFSPGPRLQAQGRYALNGLFRAFTAMVDHLGSLASIGASDAKA